MNFALIQGARRRCLLLFLATLAGAALAQQSPEPRTIASLKNPVGTVLVSQGDAMAAGVKDQRLRANARIVTTANSKVDVSFDRGCDIHLDENQRIVVRETVDCATLIATIESLGPPVAEGSGMSGVGILTAVGGALIVVGTGRSSGRNASPN